MQNKTKSALMVGQSQQVLTIVSFFHHFAVMSQEMEETKTPEAMRAMHFVKPKMRGIEPGTIQMVQLMFSSVIVLCRYYFSNACLFVAGNARGLLCLGCNLVHGESRSQKDDSKIFEGYEEV